MSFQFVEHCRIDGDARKLIRSHVMKGKNAGKVRPRKVREERGRSPIHDSDSPRMSIERDPKTVNTEDKALAPLPRGIGDDFSAFVFPCTLSPYVKNHIHQFLSVTTVAVCPAEFCLPSDVMKTIWFQYLMSDEAFFHSVLAMAEVCMDSQLGNQETSPQALLHLSNAYRCINQNLQKHEIPSDPTIAAVVSMAVHEDLRGHPSRGKVHMDALERMVAIRGGIAKFNANRALCLKLCRADIEYALHAGAFPCFYRDEFPRGMIMSALNGLVSLSELRPLCSTAGRQIYDSELRFAFTDLMTVSNVLNGDRKCHGLNPYTFQEIWVSVSYRLLQRYPLAGRRPEQAADNVWHLSMLALISTFLFRHGCFQRRSYDLLAELFRDAIQRASESDTLSQTSLLWILLVGGISLFDITDRKWFLPQLKSCLISVGIDSWENARGRIRTFPWIDAIHNPMGLELWNAVVAE